MPRSSALTQSFRTLVRWWGSELADIFVPPEGDERQRGKWLIISIEKDRVDLFEEHGSKKRKLESCPVGSKQFLEAPLEKFISTVAAVSFKRRLPVGLRLAADECLERNLTLPVAARRDLHRILALDLERSTPFHAGQVLTAHMARQDAKDTANLQVRQFVLKRDRISQIRTMLKESGVEVSHIDCWDSDRSTAVPINFLAEPSSGLAAQRRNVRLIQATVAASIILLLAAAFVHISRLESNLSEVALHTEEARNAVAEIRKAEAMAAAAERDEQSLARMVAGQVTRSYLLETLTRLIPDSDHLVELRIEGTQVSFSGYSNSTAALVPAIERSPMFAGVKLTAPVTRDRETGSDRFSLTVSTTGNVKSISAGREGTRTDTTEAAKMKEEG